jgi:hypothetical protein
MRILHPEHHAHHSLRLAVNGNRSLNDRQYRKSNAFSEPAFVCNLSAINEQPPLILLPFAVATFHVKLTVDRQLGIRSCGSP